MQKTWIFQIGVGRIGKEGKQKSHHHTVLPQKQQQLIILRITQMTYIGIFAVK